MPFCALETNNLVLLAQPLFHQGFITKKYGGDCLVRGSPRCSRYETSVLLTKSIYDFLELLRVTAFVIRQEAEPLIQVQAA